MSTGEVSEEPVKKKGWLDFLHRDNIVAPEGYNRWACVPAAIGVQMSIGSVYSWSVFNAPLTKEFGVLASTSQDWALQDVAPIFSVCCAGLGVGGWAYGKWVERVGPRKAGVAAAACYGGGLIISSVGVYTHTLPLLFLGYGLFGGSGFALGYMSPVSTLLKWFPDRRGMATGMAIFGFGGGAMLGAPLDEFFLKKYFQPPQRLGSADSMELISQAGARFVDIGGELKEVFIASSSDLLGNSNMAEGVYLCGTGNTGVAQTFLTLGCLYATTISAAAMTYRLPREGWLPEGYTPPSEEESLKVMQTQRSVTPEQAMKTPQFYLFWTGMMGNSFAGLAFISCAKNIMTEIFQPSMPNLVTGAFAGAFVGAISFFNMSGRLGLAIASDWLGRKNTYLIFGVVGVPAALSLPQITALVSAGGAGAAPLYYFCATTMTIIILYGGLLAVLPAYIADVFGTKHMGAIHGRQLLGWSASAVCGPGMLTSLRASTYAEFASDLAHKCDPKVFFDKFGADVSSLPDLLAAKTVTIGRLMEIVPAGTPDPSPMLYDKVMYVMAGVYGVAFVANLLVKPIDPKHFEISAVADAKVTSESVSNSPSRSFSTSSNSRGYSTLTSMRIHSPSAPVTVQSVVDVDFREMETPQNKKSTMKLLTK
jgi:MFS family permease